MNVYNVYAFVLSCSIASVSLWCLILCCEFSVDLCLLNRERPCVSCISSNLSPRNQSTVAACLKPRFHLARYVTSRHDTTRSTCLARRDDRVEPVELVVSSRAVRQARHSQNAWARHVECVVSCRGVT